MEKVVSSSLIIRSRRSPGNGLFFRSGAADAANEQRVAAADRAPRLVSLPSGGARRSRVACAHQSKHPSSEAAFGSDDQIAAAVYRPYRPPDGKRRDNANRRRHAGRVIEDAQLAKEQRRFWRFTRITLIVL